MIERILLLARADAPAGSPGFLENADIRLLLQPVCCRKPGDSGTNDRDFSQLTIPAVNRSQEAARQTGSFGLSRSLKGRITG
jgi:hypothetical protein